MSEGILPEVKPDGLQVWPLGHGIVATTVAVMGDKGMFIMAGVPDPMQGELGTIMPGDPVELIRMLVAIPDNQSCVMVYPNAAAIDVTISHLNDLKRMLPTSETDQLGGVAV